MKLNLPSLECLTQFVADADGVAEGILARK